MRKILLTLVLLFPLTAHALPRVSVINTNSPLFGQYANMQDIYNKSCNYAKSDQAYQSMPMFENDLLTNKYRKLYPVISNYDVHVLVFAGFELGRALRLTDLDGNYMEEICQTYALNFAAGLVNHAANTNGAGANPPPSPPSSTGSTLANPFNDLIRQSNDHHIKPTPRVLNQSACSYMYIILARHPVVEVGALDATLDMMMNMLYADYDQVDIKMSYPYLLQGAKMGRFIYASKQDIRLCYD